MPLLAWEEVTLEGVIDAVQEAARASLCREGGLEGGEEGELGSKGYKRYQEEGRSQNYQDLSRA